MNVQIANELIKPSAKSNFEILMNHKVWIARNKKNLNMFSEYLNAVYIPKFLSSSKQQFYSFKKCSVHM